MRVVAAAVLTLAVLVALPSAAEARKLPSDFFGVNWDVWLGSHATSADQEAQFACMSRTGAHSARVLFLWNAAQPQKGGPFDFRQSDGLVLAATRNRVRLLPQPMYAPTWARQYRAEAASPPRDTKAYARYLTALVRRYGPGGQFWQEHPELSPAPIRSWQIWNEPNRHYQWTIPRGRDYAPGYASLLRSAYRAVKAADRRALVVIAAGAENPSTVLTRLYARGIRGYFDVATAHPYAPDASAVVRELTRTRRVLRAHGDGKKPLWVTELGLPASRNKTTSRQRLQTTARGMADFLRASYDKIARSKSLGVGAIYWYTWASTYHGSEPDIFRYSGLVRWRGFGATAPMPAYMAFAQTVRRYGAASGPVPSGCG